MKDLRFTRADRKSFKALSIIELKRLMEEQSALWSKHDGDGTDAAWMYQSNAKDLDCLIDDREAA